MTEAYFVRYARDSPVQPLAVERLPATTDELVDALLRDRYQQLVYWIGPFEDKDACWGLFNLISPKLVRRKRPADAVLITIANQQLQILLAARKDPPEYSPHQPKLWSSSVPLDVGQAAIGSACSSEMFALMETPQPRLRENL